jgi:prophage tail gpP-like protein
MALTNIALEATIVANNKIFPGWESIEIWREFGNPTSYCKFTSAEDENYSASYAVSPGDTAQAFLCGIKVLDGYVMSRQFAADKNTHAVEIVVASKTQSAIAATVKNNPGQYMNQTLSQIASAAAATAGLTVRMTGDTSGTEIPFERVSEHIGERLIDFIGRLATWRNMHVADDSNGSLVLTRGSAGGAAAAMLVEGQNIESMRLVESYDALVDRAAFTTQRAGNDQTNGTASSQVFASTTLSNYKGPQRQALYMGEQPASQQETQLRLNHAVQLLQMDALEATITVPGWLRDDGSLWISMVGDAAPTPVTIFSPMLFPSTGGQGPSPGLFVKGVKHIQDNQGGTRTEVICCIQNGLANADKAAI